MLLLNRISGAISLSLLVSALGISLLLIGVSSVLHHQVQLLFKIRSESKQNYAALRTMLAISKGFEALDYHTLSLPPRIHGPGLITFADGSLNPIQSGNFPPALESQAITFVHLDSAMLLDQVACSSNSEAALFRVCSRYESSLSLTHAKGYLGVGLERLYDLQGEARGRGRCRELVLRSEGGMVLPGADPGSLCRARFLIPIMQLYTLYIDQKDNLRYLGHQGRENPENQPIAAGAGKISFSQLHSQVGVFSLQAVLELNSGKQLSFWSFSHIARRPVINLILNL